MEFCFKPGTSNKLSGYSQENGDDTAAMLDEYRALLKTMSAENTQKFMNIRGDKS